MTSIEIENLVHKIASTLQIYDILDRKVTNLSGGEQQRVAIGRALILQNQLLLLDEPITALHETMQEQFCILLKDIQRTHGLTVLMTTHNKDSAFLVADVMHFLEGGSLVSSIESQNVYTSALPIQVAFLLGISNVFNIEKTGKHPSTYFCLELGIDLNLIRGYEDRFQLAVSSKDVLILERADQEVEISNTFDANIVDIYFKEHDALILLSVLNTNHKIKVEMPIHKLKLMGITTGMLVSCQFKEERSRVVY